MKPLISLQLADARRAFEPGDDLECLYQIDAVAPEDILAVEASVLWRTEGKGEEEMAVHFFRRRTPADAPDGDLRPQDRFRTVLPNSPLSYDGVILKIHWCVRVRVFVRPGKDVHADLRFRLGAVPPAERPEAAGAGASVSSSAATTAGVGEPGVRRRRAASSDGDGF